MSAECLPAVSKYVPCPTCDALFRTLDDLELHVSVSVGCASSKATCPGCLLVFHSDDLLFQHTLAHPACSEAAMKDADAVSPVASLPASSVVIAFDERLGFDGVAFTHARQLFSRLEAIRSEDGCLTSRTFCSGEGGVSAAGAPIAGIVKMVEDGLDLLPAMSPLPAELIIITGVLASAVFLFFWVITAIRVLRVVYVLARAEAAILCRIGTGSLLVAPTDRVCALFTPKLQLNMSAIVFLRRLLWFI